MAFMGESAVNNYPDGLKLQFQKEAGVLSLMNTEMNTDEQAEIQI